MTAIVIDGNNKDIDCPHCKGKIDLEIERKPAKVKLVDSHTEIPSAELESMIDRVLEKRTPKKEIEAPEVKKPKAEVVAPNFMPRFRCPDGNCEIGNHKNKNYKSKPAKKCTNCDQFAPKTAKKCLWCDKEDFDDLDDDDLEGLGIPLPSIAEHEHSHDQE